jgi:hypothetical protein
VPSYTLQENFKLVDFRGWLLGQPSTIRLGEGRDRWVLSTGAIADYAVVSFAFAYHGNPSRFFRHRAFASRSKCGKPPEASVKGRAIVVWGRFEIGVTSTIVPHFAEICAERIRPAG